MSQARFSQQLLTFPAAVLRGGARRSCAPTRALVLFYLLAMAGCRLGRCDGPVSESLITSRQLSQEGIGALERGDAKQAESLLAKAIKTCPADCEARRRYADLLSQTGRKHDAVLQLTEALKHAPEDEASWVKLAELYLKLGEVDRARRSATQALQLNSRSVPALMAQARAKRKAGEGREALADFHRALSFEPENRDLLSEIAETYRQLGEPQRALANLQALADTYPPGDEPQLVLYHQGTALLSLGRHAEAVSVLTAARDRAPPSAELLFRLAEAQLRLGQTFEARDALAQALAIEPNHASSRALLDRLDVAQQPGTVRR